MFFVNVINPTHRHSLLAIILCIPNGNIGGLSRISFVDKIII